MSSADTGIPILTEIVQAPPTESVHRPAAAATASPASPMPQVVQPAVQREGGDTADIDGWLNEEWNRLERKIGGRILKKVMDRLESEIELRVRDALAETLQIAVETLSDDIKKNLQGTLQSAISEAVRDEISRMQVAKN